MPVAALLELAIAALQHASELQALYGKAMSEGGRDLTPAEVASVHALAQAANDRLAATIATMS